MNQQQIDAHSRYIVLHNIALPISKGACQATDWLDALDYFPSYIGYGGQYTWGGYVSYLLKYVGEKGFQDAMNLIGPKKFLVRYEKMPSYTPQERIK